MLLFHMRTDAKFPPALRAFGLSVRRTREARGLTQESAGEKANLDPTYISGIERGVRNPTLKVICRLAKALEVSVSQLCENIHS